MILITGGTGFIGQALIRYLAAAGYPVRILIRPAAQSPKLPKSIPVEVAVSGLNDERGLRASMVGVSTVYHLIGAERQGPRANLIDIDIQGTRAVVKEIQDAILERVQEFVGDAPQFDDITLMILSREENAPALVPQAEEQRPEGVQEESSSQPLSQSLAEEDL